MKAISTREWPGRHRSGHRARRLWGLALLAIAALWLVLPQLIDTRPPLEVVNERYDPRLSSIDSLDAAQAALPQFIEDSGAPQKDIADGIQRMLELRFVHGYPRFSARENWIAFLIGRLAVSLGGADDGTSSLPVVDSPVRPDDILKHRRAMCSQQMMTFQALLARNNIEYARVSFMQSPAHDALAAKVDGVWRYYDSDMEPSGTGVPLAEVLKGDVLPTMYPMVQNGVNMGQHFRQLAREGQVVVRDVNRYPASRGAFFQHVTEIASRWGWILPLLAGAWLLVRQKGLRRAS